MPCLASASSRDLMLAMVDWHESQHNHAPAPPPSTSRSPMRPRSRSSLRAGDGQRYTVPKEVGACQLDWPGPEFSAFPN